MTQYALRGFAVQSGKWIGSHRFGYQSEIEAPADFSFDKVLVLKSKLEPVGFHSIAFAND